MGKRVLRQCALVLSLAFLTTALAGCGKHVSGKYDAEGGMPMSMDFKGDGKVTVTIAGMAKEGTYTEDGKKITVTVDKDSHPMTMNDDGSLTAEDHGQKMTLKKK